MGRYRLLERSCASTASGVLGATQREGSAMCTHTCRTAGRGEEASGWGASRAAGLSERQAQPAEPQHQPKHADSQAAALDGP